MLRAIPPVFIGVMGLVFVTGATGFVGANLVPLLVERGDRVRFLVRPGNPAEALAGIELERVEGTLEDEGVLAEAMRGADLVVHLAALVSFRKNDRDAMFAVNAEGAARVARLARQSGVGRLLHVSTISAVAFRDRPEVVDETAPYNFGPLRIGYSDSKFAGEEAVRAEVRRGLDAVIVNPPSMFGAGDRRKAEGSLIATVLRGRARAAPPGGLNVADVASVCRGCLRAIERGRAGERYILGGENLTGRQLFERLARIAGVRPPRFTLPRALVRGLAAAATAWERIRPLAGPVTAEVLRLAPRFLWFSSRKAEEELGFAPAPVDGGIRAALAWFGGAGSPDSGSANGPAGDSSKRTG